LTRTDKLKKSTSKWINFVTIFNEAINKIGPGLSVPIT